MQNAECKCRQCSRTSGAERRPLTSRRPCLHLNFASCIRTAPTTPRRACCSPAGHRPRWSPTAGTRAGRAGRRGRRSATSAIDSGVRADRAAVENDLRAGGPGHDLKRARPGATRCRAGARRPARRGSRRRLSTVPPACAAVGSGAGSGLSTRPRTRRAGSVDNRRRLDADRFLTASSLNGAPTSRTGRASPATRCRRLRTRRRACPALIAAREAGQNADRRARRPPTSQMRAIATDADIRVEDAASGPKRRTWRAPRRWQGTSSSSRNGRSASASSDDESDPCSGGTFR